jgi:hypothetical protein
VTTVRRQNNYHASSETAHLLRVGRGDALTITYT